MNTYQHRDRVFAHEVVIHLGSNEVMLQYLSGLIDTCEFRFCVRANNYDESVCDTGYNPEAKQPEHVFINLFVEENRNSPSGDDQAQSQSQDNEQSQSQSQSQDNEQSQSQSQDNEQSQSQSQSQDNEQSQSQSQSQDNEQSQSQSQDNEQSQSQNNNQQSTTNYNNHKLSSKFKVCMIEQ